MSHINIKKILDTLTIQADWVGIREISETITHRSARNARVEKNLVALDSGYMVEVLVQGQFAYACTNIHSEAAIREAAQHATYLATKAKDQSLFKFTPDIRPPAKGEYFSAPQKKPSEVSLHDLFHILIKNSEHLKVSPKIVNTLAKALIVERKTRFVSSNNSDVFSDITGIQFELLATAQDGSQSQTRTNGAPFRQLGMEWFDEYETGLEETSARIGHQALQLLDGEECPTGHFDMVLAPDQMYIQIHESIGHPLEIDRILGDERNYAGWSFVKPSDFGKLQYGSKLLNVTFDPTLKTEGASYSFDDVGDHAEKKHLIKDGVLVAGLGGLESQKRSGIPGVANSRVSSWNRAPIDRMANINLEPGHQSFDQLISPIEDGIYMETNRSWSIDDFRNNFQFGCEYAQRIKNGKLTNVIKNPNYRGISVPFWKSLKGVGDLNTQKIWGTSFCGKGEPNQLIRVGHASPTCWFSNVSVFGGAS